MKLISSVIKCLDFNGKIADERVVLNEGIYDATEIKSGYLTQGTSELAVGCYILIRTDCSPGSSHTISTDAYEQLKAEGIIVERQV